MLIMYIKYQCDPLYRKRRLDTKSEDAIGLEPMETPMSERKTNVYYDETDGKSMFILISKLLKGILT